MAKGERIFTTSTPPPGARPGRPDQTATHAGSSAGYPPGAFQYAGVCFTGATMDEAGKEIRLPTCDITRELAQRLTRGELERVASFCERSLIAEDSPTAVIGGVRRAFASFLLDQVRLVLAGGPREY